MENQGVRLNLIFGKEIKGEGGKDKRKVLGRREKEDFWTFDPEKLRERKPERKERKGEGEEVRIQAKNNTILTK